MKKFPFKFSLAGLMLFFAIFFATTFVSAPAVGGAELAVPGLSENSEFLLQEVSQDIANVKTQYDAIMEGFPLGSQDIEAREERLAKMMSTASEDAGQWGYTDEERQRYLQLIGDLNTAYSRYEALRQSLQIRREQMRGATVSGDVKGAPPLPEALSTDINAHDAARKRLEKHNQGLDMQTFFLRSTLNKIELYLNDARQGQRALDGMTNADVPSPEKHFHELQLELTKVRVAAALQSLMEGKLRNDELLAGIKAEEDLLNHIRKHLSFTENDLKQNVSELQKQAETLRNQMTAAKENLSATALSLEKARKLVSGDVATAALTPEGSHYTTLLADLNHWEYTLTLLQDNLGWLSDAQEIWTIRYDLFHDKVRGEDIWKYRNQAQGKISELKARADSIQALQNDYYTRLAAARVQTEEATGKTKQNLSQLVQTLQKTISSVLSSYSYLIPQQLLLEQMLYEEASSRVDALRLAEQVSSFSKKTFLSFWNTPLWSGEGYSVTVSKLVLAVLLMISSFFLSNRGSRWIQRRMLRRFSANVTAANFTQRILFYILWFSFFLIALQLVRIPLTAFAFLGGAMALAFGFGAQNLFNNLISGFIIMFSRPFRVHDMVEVDGISGTVEEIGSRSTRIKTWDNVDVVMPNRYLLETKVSNWTGSDAKKRDILKIGVGYDSDSRQVEELLLKVAKTHSKVLKEPQPFVLLNDFAESSLNFTLYFWVDLETSSSAKVASDMRHHLLSIFRNEGIRIPYPQRDVHFAPLELQTTPLPQEKTEEKEDEPQIQGTPSKLPR